jgi:hypothetical protein
VFGFVLGLGLPGSQECCVRGRWCVLLLVLRVLLVCHQLRKVPLCDEPPLSIDKPCTVLQSLLPPNLEASASQEQDDNKTSTNVEYLNTMIFIFSPDKQDYGEYNDSVDNLFDVKRKQKNAFNALPTQHNNCLHAPSPLPQPIFGHVHLPCNDSMVTSWNMQSLASLSAAQRLKKAQQHRI